MEYMLYAAPKQAKAVQLGNAKRRQKAQAKKKGAGLGSMPPTTVPTEWSEDVPILVRAMVLAGKTLFLAGPPDLIDEPKTLESFETPETQQLLRKQAAALEGSEGALLWAVSATDGQKLVEQKLEQTPVFDGMIAAGDRIYYATTDGQVIALGGKSSQ